MSSRALEEAQERRHDELLAEKLGLTLEELHDSSYEEDQISGDDGEHYGYTITFDKSTPKAILRKIKGLSDTLVVRLDPWDLDRDEPEDD